MERRFDCLTGSMRREQKASIGRLPSTHSETVRRNVVTQSHCGGLGAARLPENFVRAPGCRGSMPLHSTRSDGAAHLIAAPKSRSRSQTAVARLAACLECPSVGNRECDLRDKYFT